MGGMFVMPALDAIVIMAVITMVAANPATSAPTALKSVIAVQLPLDRSVSIKQVGNPDCSKGIP
jgi:hypothetical protein